MLARTFYRSLITRLINDDISFLAGGVAFYGLLALFPALSALVALIGLLANPQIIQDELEQVRFLFPPEVMHLLKEQIVQLAAQSSKTLSITMIFSTLLALYSANRGAKALLAALAIIFRVQERRSWLKQQGVAIAITLGGIGLVLLALACIIIVPVLVALLPADIYESLLRPLAWLRWLFLGSVMFTGMLILFAVGPNRPYAARSIKALLLGTAVASLCWLVTVIAGSWFITKLPDLHAAYGSLSAVIVLMLWMVGSAYCVLLGAATAAAFDEARLEIAGKR